MKLHKKGIALVRNTTILLILSVLGFIFLFWVSIDLATIFMGTPDQNLATVDIIIGEIDQGIEMLQLTGESEYEIVFPLSLEPSYQITSEVPADKSYSKLVLYDEKEKKVHTQRLKKVALTFESKKGLNVPSTVLRTPSSTLQNHKLTLTRRPSSGSFIAKIAYCEDGWCQ